MAFTYDLTTDIGKVRLLINDKYSAEPIFQDDELDAFLLFEANRVKRAAALAYETIARDEALIGKVVKTLQLSTDGAKLSAEMRAHAQALRKQDSDDLATDQTGFDIAEWAIPPFGTLEYIDKSIMRNG